MVFLGLHGCFRRGTPRFFTVPSSPRPNRFSLRAHRPIPRAAVIVRDHAETPSAIALKSASAIAEIRNMHDSRPTPIGSVDAAWAGYKSAFPHLESFTSSDESSGRGMSPAPPHAACVSWFRVIDSSASRSAMAFRCCRRVRGIPPRSGAWPAPRAQGIRQWLSKTAT